MQKIILSLSIVWNSSVGKRVTFTLELEKAFLIYSYKDWYIIFKVLHYLILGPLEKVGFNTMGKAMEEKKIIVQS
jgi:hypothetical protein